MQGRHELKHSLNYMDYKVLQSKIKAVMTPDKNADENGEYSIKSLYFDTPKDKALRDKIDGANNREKFRIRMYNNDSGYIVLEKKSKINNLCYKTQEVISHEETIFILDGKISWMINKDRPLVTEFYSKISGSLLRPKVIVEYIREPYICKTGNVRVTFDKEIRTGLYSTDFFNNKLPKIPAGDNIVLLEVKYDNFIPQYITDILQTKSRRASAFSKYAVSRIYG